MKFVLILPQLDHQQPTQRSVECGTKSKVIHILVESQKWKMFTLFNNSIISIKNLRS